MSRQKTTATIRNTNPRRRSSGVGRTKLGEKRAVENHGTATVGAATIGISNDARAFGATAQPRCLLLGGQRASALQTVIIPVVSAAQQALSTRPRALVRAFAEARYRYRRQPGRGVGRLRFRGTRARIRKSTDIVRRFCRDSWVSANSNSRAPVVRRVSTVFSVSLSRSRNSFKLAARFYTFRRSVFCRPRG